MPAAAMALVMVMMTGCGKTPAVTEPVEDAKEYVVTDVNFDSSVEVAREDNHRVFYEIFVGSFPTPTVTDSGTYAELSTDLTILTTAT